MVDNKYLAPLYLIAFIASLVVFFGKHQWGWLAASVIWLVLGIYSFIRYNRNGNDLDK